MLCLGYTLSNKRKYFNCMNSIIVELPNPLVVYFLAAFYTIVALFYTVIIKLKKSTSCSNTLVHMGKPHSLHWYNHLTFRAFRIAIWAACVMQVFIPTINNYLGLFTELLNPVVQTIGCCLMMLGFSLAIYCNLILDKSWRSGVDPNSKPGLVTHLIYARSRNPSYLGVATSQFGFFMAWPTIFSLVCLLVGLIALRIQIYLEEQFLLDLYKDEYKLYVENVPRYI